MTEYLNGHYRAKAKNWTLGEAKTGTVQVVVDCELLEGPATGQSRTWYGFFTEKALATTLKALRAFGWQGSDPLELENRGGGLDKNEVSLVIEPEDYDDEQGNPRTRERVQWVNALGGAAASKPLSADKRPEFSARMKASILASETGQGAPRSNGSPRPVAVRTPPPGLAPNDDIPF